MKPTRKPAAAKAAAKAAPKPAPTVPEPEQLSADLIAGLVAECEQQRDALLRDVFTLDAAGLAQLAQVTALLEQHRG